MTKPTKIVAVTGGLGQIAYSLLFSIASGSLFGMDQPIELRILEVPACVKNLEGVVMELQDCCFPLLQNIQIGFHPEKLFEGADIVILIGAKPRGPGMERKDLLTDNGKIFVEQGKALNKTLSKQALVFVVGNPCNTNCFIAMRHAPDLHPKQFHAMTRLDQNRAQFQLAQKAGCASEDVTNITIWGNHSATQVPDFVNALIQNKPAEKIIKDRHWLENDFFETIQKRGAAVIQARGKSSAASAAHAILDGIKSILYPTKEKRWYSSAIYSKNNPYHIDEDLVFSFPCCTNKKRDVEIVKNLKWDSFLEEKIQKTQQELISERELIAHLL